MGPRVSPPNVRNVLKADIDASLPRTIVEMSDDVLSTIANSNPGLYREWMAEIRRQHGEVDAEARRLRNLLHRLHEAPHGSNKEHVA